jgi:hypothetical protein
MIKLQNYTPEIYYKESRDFQFIGRLFDLVLNAVKTDADLLYHIPLSTDSDEKLLELLAMTLGFKPKHQYNARQLKAVCSVFNEILKHKGSIKALKIACESLFNAMDISQALDYDFTEGKNNTELNLYLPPEFEDTIILQDLLTYVLPAGMSCNIIKELQIKTDSNTAIGITDSVVIGTIDSNNYSQILRLTTTGDTDLTSGTISTGDAIKALMNEKDEITGQLKARPGFSVNSEIIKLEDTNNG